MAIRTDRLSSVGWAFVQNGIAAIKEKKKYEGHHENSRNNSGLPL